MANMKVVGGNLNVRKAPTLDSEVIHVLADGDEITAGREQDGWCKFGSGYVMSRWLEPIEAEEPVTEEPVAKKASKKKQNDK